VKGVLKTKVCDVKMEGEPTKKKVNRTLTKEKLDQIKTEHGLSYGGKRDSFLTRKG